MAVLTDGFYRWQSTHPIAGQRFKAECFESGDRSRRLDQVNSL